MKYNLKNNFGIVTNGKATIRGVVHYMDGTSATIRGVVGAIVVDDMISIDANKRKTLGSEKNVLHIDESYCLSLFDIQSIVWTQSVNSIAINTVVWHLHKSTKVGVDISINTLPKNEDRVVKTELLGEYTTITLASSNPQYS